MFKVGFSYTESGYAYIEAESEEQAEEFLSNHLDEYGLDELDYETTDRDFFSQDSEEVEESLKDGRRALPLED